MALVGIGSFVIASPALAQDCPELFGQWPNDEVLLVIVEEPYAYASNETTLMVSDISDPAAPET
jgi:hypothetical protein